MSIIGSNILAGSSGQGGAYEIEQSLRFNSADSAYLNRTSAAGNRRTFTASAWVKKAALAFRLSSPGLIQAALKMNILDFKFLTPAILSGFFQELVAPIITFRHQQY